MERLVPLTEPEHDRARITSKFGCSMLSTELHVVCVIYCLMLVYVFVTLTVLGASLVAQLVKNSPAIWETWV